MSRGDVSFTFISRIEEIEQNIKDARWQSALALALTIPDICGNIAHPELIRRHRDGKIVLDKNGNTNRDIGLQYKTWFDETAGSFFKKHEDDETPYICGERCWQLRCEYLHQNKGFVNNADNVHFHLGINCGTSICNLDNSDENNIRIDIEQFCIRMCLAARKFYNENANEKDFSLYNTPVIDFVKWHSES